MDNEHSWASIHAERARLFDLLEGLGLEQWNSASLCTAWSVEQVTAHLTAAARTGMWAWFRSIVGAGFNSGKHNDRRLAQYLGSTADETLSRFRDSVSLTIAPSKDYAAWLGEVIVHGQDIARPLGIDLEPEPSAVSQVAQFYATKDFAVKSHSLIKGLSLEADDSSFKVGQGPLVRGHLLDLVMAMAGRTSACSELTGDGVSELTKRSEARGS